MLRQRVASAVILLPLLIASVWFNEPLPWFTVLAGIWGLLAAVEFYRLSRRYSPLNFAGLLFILLMIISGHSGAGATLAVLGLAATLTLVILLFRSRKENAFLSWAWTIGGVVYIGLLSSYFVALRQMPEGRNWVFLALFVTFASDTTAYFIGKTWGRHKLLPAVSPKKTWEGAVGGVGGAVIIGLLFSAPQVFGVTNTFYISGLTHGEVILLSLCVSIFGQAGDLAESLLKRNLAAKDSGTSIPGHGGFLDRLDSLLFAGLVVYFYALWFSG